MKEAYPSNRRIIRYSEAFKRSVVKQLEEGKFASITAARAAYNISGTTTINRWLRQFGNEALLPKVVKIQSMKEQDELKTARKRIRELEAALSDAHIDHSLEEAYLQIACEQLGVEPEAFKKKRAITLSQLRKQRSKAKGLR